MTQAVTPKRMIRAMVIACTFGLLVTACSGGKEFKVHEVDAIAEGPGFLTGEDGEATFDPATGQLKMGNGAAIAKQNKRSIEIRRRRARARRRQEGATGG